MKLCTHNGPFQADDVLATAILTKLFPQAQIIRSRDPLDWHDADIVFDVGEANDGIKFFDHHQPGGGGARDNQVPYAAVGLIWQKFGLEYCRHFSDDSVSPEHLWQYVDEHFIQGVDASDCGKTKSQTQLLSNGHPLHMQTFSSIIDAFNPLPLLEEQSQEHFLNAFLKALDFAAFTLERITRSAYGTEKAKSIVFNADTGHPILELPMLCQWRDCVIDQLPHVLFVIHPSTDDQFLLRTVPVQKSSFTARCDLPKSWAGLSGQALQQQTGVNDAVFCHNGLFIAGAKTLEGIKQLADIAVQNGQKSSKEG